MINIFEDGKLNILAARDYLASMGFGVCRNKLCRDDGSGSFTNVFVSDMIRELESTTASDDEKKILINNIGSWQGKVKNSLPAKDMRGRKTSGRVSDHIRVDGAYFRMRGDELIPVKRQTFVDDFGLDAIADVRKYDRFWLEPNHVNYQQEIGNDYNAYKAISHEPKKGNCNTILGFMHHIFGDQYEIGMDYMQLLYLKPKQMLPILCLVSDERQTGKSTFGEFLIRIFQGNATKLNQQVFNNVYNASYADRVVAYIDESKISSIKILEQIKDLSTSTRISVRRMQQEFVETPFYCKFVLMSNYVDNFVNVDEAEIRYWIREVKPFNGQSEGSAFIDKLESEIPAFLYLLINRKMNTPKCMSRMWFTAEQLDNQQLQDLKIGSVSKRLKSALIWMADVIASTDSEFDYLSEFKLPASVLSESCYGNRVSSSECKDVIRALFPGYTKTKKSRDTKFNLYNKALNAHVIPIYEVEKVCMKYGIIDEPFLESEDATQEEIKEMEGVGLIDRIP